MSKALIGLAALAGLGGYALYNSKKASASPLPSDTQELGQVFTVTGSSGRTYNVQQQNPGEELQLFNVSDVNGFILQYAQIRGDNSVRSLTSEPEAQDSRFDATVADFGITGF